MLVRYIFISSDVGYSQFNSTNEALNVSETALKKLEKRKNDTMQSMDEHMNQETDKYFS